MKSQAVSRSVLLATLVVIFYLAVTPKRLPLVEDIYDKIKHLAAFLVLGVLADLSFPKASRLTKFFSLLFYGLFIEVVQHFLPYRDASFWDLLADALGLGLSGLLFPLFKRLPLFKLAD